MIFHLPFREAQTLRDLAMRASMDSTQHRHVSSRDGNVARAV
jgi:hypothetical protein